MTKWAHIEHPDAYAAAIDRRIKQNAWTRRRRELEEKEPEVAAWIGSRGFENDGPEVYDDDLQDYRQPRKEHPAGQPPLWLIESCDKWGGLTERQLEAAKRILAERTTKRAEWAAKRAEEKANAPHWTEGRQTIEGKLLSFRWQDSGPVWGRGGSFKGLVKLDDGRTLWTSIPTLTAEDGTAVKLELIDRLAMAVRVEPKTEDPTFGFGSRPTKARIVSLKEAK